MANPYHDSAGKFCSKGEMVADLKRLSKDPANFTAYFELRKSYDSIQKTQHLSTEEAIDEYISNKPKISIKTAESSLQSYELVKDRLGDKDGRWEDHGYVSHLMESRYLPEDVRKDILTRGSTIAVRDAIERDLHRENLSNADYQAIMTRPDVRELEPVIAKNIALSFEERSSLIGDTAWGNALLAMHDSETFFKHDKNVAKLREDALIPDNGLNDSNSVVSGLAYSPYTEDHEAVINNPQLNKGYPSPAMTLSRNRSVGLASSIKLLKAQVESQYSGNGTAWNIQNRMSNSVHEFHYDRRDKLLAKHKYHDDSMTLQRKGEIQAKIKTLNPPNGKFVVTSADLEEESKADFLYGKLYANDDDYKALTKELSKSEKKLASTKNKEDEKHVYKLRKRALAAESIRRTSFVIETLEKVLARNPHLSK